MQDHDQRFKNLIREFFGDFLDVAAAIPIFTDTDAGLPVALPQGAHHVV